MSKQQPYPRHRVTSGNHHKAPPSHTLPESDRIRKKNQFQTTVKLLHTRSLSVLTKRKKKNTHLNHRKSMPTDGTRWNISISGKRLKTASQSHFTFPPPIEPKSRPRPASPLVRQCVSRCQNVFHSQRHFGSGNRNDAHSA